jgi:hypothetical protein
LNHVAIHEEGQGGTLGSIVDNDFNHQIWDLVYINTNAYAADTYFGGAGAAPFPSTIPRNSDNTDAIPDTAEWNNQ